jgi:hypothetical protein
MIDSPDDIKLAFRTLEIAKIDINAQKQNINHHFPQKCIPKINPVFNLSIHHKSFNRQNKSISFAMLRVL